MKKILLSAAAVLAFGFANAQEDTTKGGFSAGDAFISGTVSFGSEKTGEIKANEFNFSPRAAYFINDNIALGLELGYMSSKEDIADDGFGTYEEKTTGFEIGAFGRYYFTPANKFSLFTQLGAGYGTAKVEVESFENKANGFYVAFAPGLNYFVSEHFALEATFGVLSYSSVKPDADGAESTNSFEIGLDMADINFGIVYKF
ncbi:flavo-specific protein antigen FspA [Flavobacterium suaedae]|uniref:Flavo-specific protein antigen FspA n=1 Tax=Flavobacterium suaedae TaxID=1767027 RepID=A0ABQ1JSZ1_9FLAO|nr:outer membrane beta-barrel protein [Flavobacterium suaedae]GGB74518.1 flavo-specific protein antigen FspA [Flavobacterium suaedae]